MKNAYPSYQEFHMHQPFFSFDVKQYEELVQTTPYTARFYQFSTHKIIDRSQNQDLFMVCIPDGCVDVVFIQHDQQYKLELIGSPLARKPLIVYPDAAYFGIRMKPGMFFPDVPLSRSHQHRNLCSATFSGSLFPDGAAVCNRTALRTGCHRAIGTGTNRTGILHRSGNCTRYAIFNGILQRRIGNQRDSRNALLFRTPPQPDVLGDFGLCSENVCPYHTLSSGSAYHDAAIP